MKHLRHLALCPLLVLSLITSAFALEVPDQLVVENLNGQQRMVGCVNTGDVYSDAAKVTDKSHTTGGLAGYIYNEGFISYSASLGNVTADYNKDTFKDGTELTVGGLASYQNSSNGDYMYNYFTGTLNAGTHGTAILVKNVVGSKLSDEQVAAKLVANFSVNTYPLFYHKSVTTSGSEQWSVSTQNSAPITSDTSSAAFINTLNDAAGAGTFVMVTTCEGESFPIYKDTVATFNMTRTHSDENCDYYTVLNNDDTTHWYQCEVCGAKDLTTVQEHTGGTANCQSPAECTVCEQPYGSKDADNHVNAYEWVKDANGHSTNHTCCGVVIENEPHAYEDGICSVCGYVCLHDQAHAESTVANCESPAYCGTCQMSYGEIDPDHHVFETEWSFDRNTEKHYYACSNSDCPARSAEAACSGGDAKCNALAQCEVCEHEYGVLEAEDHASTNYKYVPNADDASKHDKLRACCDELIDTTDHGEENHKADATCRKPAECELCGFYGSVNLLNHEAEPSAYQPDPDDPARHNVIYGDCCGTVLPEAHTGGTATCNVPAKCSLCNNYYGAAIGEHDYSSACDESCDVCGTTRVPGAHAFGDWTVTKEATETEFGTQERTCSNCGKTQTASVSVITNPESALDSVTDHDGQKDFTWLGVLVLGGAVLLVGGVIAAFVISKKRKAK